MDKNDKLVWKVTTLKWAALAKECQQALVEAKVSSSTVEFIDGPYPRKEKHTSKSRKGSAVEA